MIMDPSSGVGQGMIRPERPEINPVADDSNRARPERPEAGSASEVGPAVVTSFSAAARELARPVNENEQPTDQNRAEENRRRELNGRERQAEERQAEELAARRRQENAPRGSRVDRMI